MRNDIQTPTIGRMVHFHSTDKAGLGLNLSPLPAVITRVWSDEMVNVAVFPDGYGPAQLIGVTSVAYADNDDDRARQSYSWCWPPKV